MSTAFKNQLIRHLLYFLLGALGLALCYESTSIFRFVALAGFLVMIREIIWFLGKSEPLLMRIAPTSTTESHTRWQDQAWSYLIGIAFFVALLGIILEMTHLEKIIDELEFWGLFGAIGLLAGILFLGLLFVIQPSVFQLSRRRQGVLLGVLLSFPLLSVVGASRYNRTPHTAPTQSHTYAIVQKSTGGKNNHSHWIFVHTPKGDKRFTVSATMWATLYEGQSITLITTPGKLHYPYVIHLGP